jgi:hypothetical protein
VVCLFQPQGLAHHSSLFVCHQHVSGVAISTTRPGSPFWPFVCHQDVSGVVISTTRPGLPFLPLLCHQGVSGLVISTTRPGSPFWPFVCHQDVSGVVILITRPGLPFLPLFVPSASKCYCMLMKHLLIQHYFSFIACGYFTFNIIL